MAGNYAKGAEESVMTFLDSGFDDNETLSRDVQEMGGNKTSFFNKVFSKLTPERKQKYVDDLIDYAQGSELFRVPDGQDVKVGDLKKPEVLEAIKQMGGTPESFIGEVNRRRKVIADPYENLSR